MQASRPIRTVVFSEAALTICARWQTLQRLVALRLSQDSSLWYA
jgi:hypothetical protein